MPMNIYDSPASLRPDIGFKPEGGLGGWLFNERNQDYRQSLEQSNLMKAMEAKTQMNEMQDYTANTPVRNAERLSKIAGFNSSAANIGDIQGGQASVGRSQVAQEKERDLTAHLDYLEKADKQHVEQIGRAASLMDSYGPGLIDPNIPAPERMRRFDELKKQFPEMGLPEQYDPNVISQHVTLATNMKDALAKREQAAQVQKDAAQMERTKEETRSREAVAKAQRDAHLLAASKADGVVKTYQAQMNRLTDQKYEAAKPGSKITWGAQDQEKLDRLEKQIITEKSFAAVSAAIPALLLQGQNVSPEAIGNAVRGIAMGMMPQKSSLATPEAQWNAEWAKVPPGGSLKGPDGVMYKKKEQ